MVILKFLTVGK